MSRSRTGLALLALLAAGCTGHGGGGQGSGARPSAALDGLHGRRCEYVTEPEALPALEELVELGTRGNLALWGRNATASDSVHISLRYDGEGRLAWAQALESTMDRARTAELERLIRSAVRDQGPADWGVRMRFVAGDLAGVDPSVVCEPVRSGEAGLVGAPLGTPQEMAELYRTLGRRFYVQVSLDEQGRVMDVRLPHSSGIRLLDQYVIDMARATRFEPKLHDGIGIPALLTIRVNYRPNR